VSARALTPELYEAILAYYRRAPGGITGCSRACGIGYDMAKRAWAGPPWKNWPWAKPAKEYLEAEAAAKAAKETDAEAHRRAALTSEYERAKKLETEAKTVEENVLRVVRNNVLAGAVGMAKIVGGMTKLAERVNAQLERGTDAKGQPLDIDVAQALQLMGRFATSTRHLVDSANTLVALGRLRQGLPTSILGVEASVSLEEAEAEIEAASVAIAKARAMGLTVVEGGRVA
jgi:hypothetical protein